MRGFYRIGMLKEMKSVMLVLMVGMTALAQTPEERQRAVDYLTSTRTALHNEIAGLTEAQAKFKAAPAKWSVLEITEHLAATEAGILGIVFNKLKEPPSPPEKRDAVRGKDTLVTRAVPNRTTKVQAPEEVRPTGRWATLAEAVAEFDKARGRTLDFVKTGKQDLRAYHHKHFALGDLDAYQWMLLLAAHCERHIAQIREVRGEAGFPGN